MAKRSDTGAGRSSAKPAVDENGPEPGRGVAQKAKEQARHLAHGAKRQTRRVAERARDEVEEIVGRQRARAADRLGHVAQALREAGLRLNEGEQGSDVGGYADRAAGQVERLCTYLRDTDLRGLLRDTEDFARRRPALFLGGTFLAGLALARFLKSSAPAGPYQGSTVTRRSAYAPARRNPDAGELAVGGTTPFSEPIGV